MQSWLGFCLTITFTFFEACSSAYYTEVYKAEVQVLQSHSEGEYEFWARHPIDMDPVWEEVEG